MDCALCTVTPLKHQPPASAAQGTGRPVNMEEEFRLLTLQVIGEAILGLHHDECDQVGGRALWHQLAAGRVASNRRLSSGAHCCTSLRQVFPQLYLPVMEEANLRVLAPWREYLPTPARWTFNSRMRRLNSYILGLLRKRWAAHQSGQGPDKPDVLERILDAVQVHPLHIQRIPARLDA
jgi:hypothetical protein